MLGVRATHVHLKMSLSVTHPLHTACPKTAFSYINSFCAIVQALPTRKTFIASLIAGNLTKHMKSKAHSKKCLEMGVPAGLIEDQDADDSGTVLHCAALP